MQCKTGSNIIYREISCSLKAMKKKQTSFFSHRSSFFGFTLSLIYFFEDCMMKEIAVRTKTSEGSDVKE